MNKKERKKERKKAVYSLIHGGCGNQLSQIAVGYIISKEVDRPLFFDKRVMGPTHSKSHDAIINQIMDENFRYQYLSDDKYYLNYDYNNFFPIIRFLRKDGFSDKPLLLGGLINEWNYFYKYKEDLFSLFHPFISNEIRDKRIGFHFRLGDYTYYLPELIISNNYILNAIKGMIERGASHEIDCFTEEPEKAKIRIEESLASEPSMKEIRINFVHEDDLTTFKKMQEYRYFISSLSSFSWWANFFAMSFNNDRVLSLVELKNFRFSKNQFCPES